MKYILFILFITLFAVPGRADSTGVLAARVIKLNFVKPHDVEPMLTAMKSAEGRVVVNEDGQSIALMDTADRVAAMDALVRQIDIQTVTSVMPLQFGRADQVVGEVRGLLTQSIGTIAADNTANAITVTDTPAVVDRVRRAVTAFDQRGRKFIFEAKLIHITLDDEHAAGVDWAGIVADHQQFRLEGAYDFLAGQGHVPALSLGTIEDKDMMPLVEALDTVGMVREYPVVDVVAGADADVRLTVRFDEPFVSLTVGDDEDVEDAAGSSLSFSLKSSVEADGGIKTVLLPEESPEALKAAGVKATPAVRHPRAVTVRTTDNGTIVVGGLMTSDNILVPRKVPLIGDVPILGLAFRYHNNSVRREEFVVFLTPRPAVQEPASDIPADNKAGR